MEHAGMKMKEMTKAQMLEWVMMLGFCAYDMLLYLDTHPKDAVALSYYRECNHMYKEAKENYEIKYGPLTAESAGKLDMVWDWSKQPLPWEGGV